MTERHWEHSVILIPEDSSSLVVITTTKEAMDMLRNRWPKTEGDAYTTAIRACEAVAEKRAMPMDARAAFILAAADAGIPMQI